MTTTALDSLLAGEAGSVSGEAGPGPVPCLSNNKCNGFSVKPCGNDRKKGESVRQNLDLFVRQKGAAAALFTITFAEDLTTKEAQRRFHSFCAGVLLEHFGDRISVREFTGRGRPHFHVMIDCLGDVTTGFNWDHYDAVTLWSKTGRKGAKPRGNLNRTERLAELHQLLNEKGPKYGLGRMELVPVRKPEGVAFYLGAYLSKSQANKPKDAKGTRSVNYSHKCPRSHKGDFSWANASGWLWRAKLAQWCLKRGWDEHQFAVMRGEFSKWIYTQREFIVAEELSYWPTFEHAKRDNYFNAGDLKELGPDAIHIRRLPFPSRSPVPGSTSPGPVSPKNFLAFLSARAFLHLAFREVGSQVEVEEVEVPGGAVLLVIPRLHCQSSNVKSGLCDSSQAPRGVVNPPAMFPPEEGFEGKRGAPLQAAPDGVSKRMDGRTFRDYPLDSKEDTTERAGRILYGHNPF